MVGGAELACLRSTSEEHVLIAQVEPFQSLANRINLISDGPVVFGETKDQPNLPRRFAAAGANPSGASTT